VITVAPAPERQRAAQWFRPGYPDQNVRVSDADRSDVADRLARHYGDGRLDQAEFDDRVTRAMAAKTAADFQGLFDDLPDLPPDATDGKPGAAPGTPGYMAPRHRRSPFRVAVIFALALIAASAAWHAVINPWGWIVAAVVIVMVTQSRRRRACRRR
jgi:hypothetical protein